MTRLFAVTLSLLISLALAASPYAKGSTIRITISGSTLPAPIDIMDSAVLAKFQVWAGPGVSYGRRPDGTVFEEKEGFIIDWSSGVVGEHRNGLPRYQVAFYVSSSDQPVYVVFYEPDSSGGGGYVYLPGRGDDLYQVNGRAMSHGHGLEGHWLRASGEWESVAAPLIARATR
jgi:hypothetical protein